MHVRFIKNLIPNISLKVKFLGAKANSFSWLFGSLFHMHTAFSREKKYYFCWHIFSLLAESNEWVGCAFFLWLNNTARTHSLSFNGLCRDDTGWNIWYQRETVNPHIVVKLYKSFLCTRDGLKSLNERSSWAQKSHSSYLEFYFLVFAW